MKKYYPHKNALKVLRVLSFFVAIILTFVARIYLSTYPMLMYWAVILFWVAFILFAFVGLPFYFTKTYYYVSADEIAKQSGLFFESRQLMRVNSIQYVTRISTPFSNFTGFNFLKMNALGGYLVILFLSKSDSEEIESIISASVRKNAG